MSEITLEQIKTKADKPVPKKIVYRIDHTFEREPVPLFSEEEDEWTGVENDDGSWVPKKTGGKINCQAQIQSYEDCALEKILDKYLKDDNVEEIAKVISSSGVEKDDGVMREHISPDLADLGEEYERAEMLKEKYNLDPALSYEQTLSALQQRKADLDAQIIELQKKEKENEKTQDGEKK